jgi:hypothetical protein
VSLYFFVSIIYKMAKTLRQRKNKSARKAARKAASRAASARKAKAASAR